MFHLLLVLLAVIAGERAQKLEFELSGPDFDGVDADFGRTRSFIRPAYGFVDGVYVNCGNKSGCYLPMSSVRLLF